jgi:hypothetical protein
MGAPKVTNSLLHPLCYLPSLPSPNIKNCSRGFIEFPAVVGGVGVGGLSPTRPTAGSVVGLKEVSSHSQSSLFLRMCKDEVTFSLQSCHAIKEEARFLKWLLIIPKETMVYVI